MEILTHEELDLLLEVTTSIHFAERILKRNAQLLDYLETLPTTVEELKNFTDEDEIAYKGYVGCPHCHFVSNKCSFLCGKCEWLKVTNELGAMFPCCRVTFGGISHRTIADGPYV